VAIVTPIDFDAHNPEVQEETGRILQSGITEDGRFVLREGGNLAPATPEENVAAIYAACKEFGRYG